MQLYKKSPKKPMINEAPRKMMFLKSPIIPLQELWQTIGNYSDYLKNKEESHKDEMHGLVRKLCKNIFDLRRIIVNAENDPESGGNDGLIKRMRMILENFNDILSDFNYKMEVLDGKRWSEIDPDAVEMLEYVQDEKMEEIVISDTLFPVIKFEDTIIDQAKVFVLGPLKQGRRK